MTVYCVTGLAALRNNREIHNAPWCRGNFERTLSSIFRITYVPFCTLLC